MYDQFHFIKKAPEKKKLLSAKMKWFVLFIKAWPKQLYKVKITEAFGKILQYS